MQTKIAMMQKQITHLMDTIVSLQNKIDSLTREIAHLTNQTEIISNNNTEGNISFETMPADNGMDSQFVFVEEMFSLSDDDSDSEYDSSSD